MKQRGSTDWTIGRLMTIVLLVIVLVLVVYGVSTKGLNPLIERAGGMFDSVRLMFGFGDGDVERDCVVYSEDVAGVGSGIVSSCRGSCSFELEEGLSFGKKFNWTGGSLFVKAGSSWNEIWDVVDNVPLAIREREVNGILMEEFEGYAEFSEGDSFMSSGIVPIYVLVRGDAGRKKYFKWEDEGWFEEKDNKWERRSWDSFGGLKKIYSESNDVFLDDDVFFRIGNSDTVRMYHLREEGDSFVFVEGIGANDDSYELFDIFSGGSGKIMNDDDFGVFQKWFSSEKGKIRENQEVLDEGMEEFKELLPLESSGEFEGEPYYLFIERDSNGEGVFYLETSAGKYGLKGKELKLVRDFEEAGWKVAESSSTLSEGDEKFEERIKIHRIRKFLEVLCG